MDILRWGMLSTAKIGLDHVVPATQAARRCEVVAVASRDAARGQAAADAAGIPRVHDSYEALLADPDVDAVYVPLPNHLHAEWTIAAARAGKHVLCEKPLALTSDDAQGMVDACRDAGVVFAEAFMYRLHPQWVAVRDLVASGLIGDLQAVQTFFAYHNADPSNIRNVPEYGGGALMDIGCYAIDLSRMLFDAEPVSVDGVIRVHPEFGTDMLTSGVMAFPGGGQATFTCGTQTQPSQWVHVVGSAGRITVEVPFNTPPDVPARLLVATADAPAAQIREFGPANHYTLQAEAFAAAVLDDEPLATPPENGVADMRVIEALRASAQH